MFFKRVFLCHICPVGWGCRIHRLHLCRGLRPLHESPGYDTKQSDGEVPVMLELWGMQSTPLLPLLLSPLRSGVVAPDRVLSMSYIKLNCEIELFWHVNCVLMLNWIVWTGTVSDYETVLMLNWIFLNRTVLTFNCM